MASTRAFITLLVVLAISATAVSVASATTDRKLLQAPQAAQGQCGPPTAVYVGDDDNSCQQCASKPNTVAWCCRSDDTASSTECKQAGANCCQGQEFKYTETERDDGELETDDGELDDVWCVPATCQANFQPPQAPQPAATGAVPAANPTGH